MAALERADAIYAEAEWTLQHTMEQFPPSARIPRFLRPLFPFPGWRSRRAVLLILELVQAFVGYSDGDDALELQGDLRRLGDHLRSVLMSSPDQPGVDTRDGFQFLSDRGPIQGAALLVLSWADLATVRQRISTQQVNAVGALVRGN